MLGNQVSINYTIPRNNRELQPNIYFIVWNSYYTIPRNNRELQPSFSNNFRVAIIPYQEIIGNYSYSMSSTLLI